MEISSATIIYFSPTGTTRKIINSVVKGMDIVCHKQIDLTLPKVRNTLNPSIEGDIVIIGVPVYATGVPKILNAFLTSLQGKNKPVVLIAVYGNMSEGVTLNELYTMAENSEFKVVAAGSFIGEHSFSISETPIAEGRPNSEDLKKAEEFGINIMKKLQKINDTNYTSIKIPQGETPVMAKILPQNSAKLFTKLPLANMNICSHCGICVKLCPMNAIDKDSLEINKDLCLRCFSCVKRCPKKARKIIYKPKFLVSKVLASKNKINKEP